MPTVKLPDGKDLTFQSKVTGLEVAEKNKQITFKTGFSNEH